MFLFCFFSALSQKRDSLNFTPEFTPKDSNDVIKLLQEGEEMSLRQGGDLLALNYHQRALQLARQINYLKGEADALRQIAQIESVSETDLEKIVNYFLEELKYREQLNDPEELSRSFELLGDFFRKKTSNFQEAIGYYKQAYRVLKGNKTNEKKHIELLNKIAQNYALIDSTEQSLDHYNKILEIYLQRKGYEDAVNLSLEIAQAYAQNKNYSRALDFARQSKKINMILKQSVMDVKYDEYIRTLEALREDEENKKFKYRLLFWIGIVSGLIIFFFLGKYIIRKIW